MRTAVVIVLAALALAAGAFLLLRKEGEGFLGFGGAEERARLEEEERALLEASPSLQGSPGGPRPRAPELPPDAIREQANAEGVLQVRVLDDVTGKGIAGAFLELYDAMQPCPSLRTGLTEVDWSRPVSPHQDSSSLQRKPSRPEPRTDSEGVFAYGPGLTVGAQCDVFAGAPGYVIGVACDVRVPGEATLRLIRGAPLRGRVVDRLGKALQHASVRVEPGTGTPLTLGHLAGTSSDEHGMFSIDGLLPGAHKVTVTREGFWPLTVENEDPADPRERTYVLTPAFVLKFRLRANDGREIVNPTLQATAAARQPFSVVQILKITEDTTNDGRLTVGVPVPATLGLVSLEVKAEGYAAWRAPEVVVPPEGGEQTFPITLGRDTGQGGVRLKFEDERGQPVKYGEMHALPPSIQPLERQDLAGGIVYEIKEDLRFPALPPGRYRFGMTAFAYAPVSVEAVVFSGGEAEVRVPLRAAARLKVRFTAQTARTVRFRLTQGGRFVPALPEKAPSTPPDPTKPDEESLLAAGEDGVVLGGLGSGTYVVEVLSEDLQASRTSVSVREGETEEVEIRVQPR
jgi:hypothetical protein